MRLHYRSKETGKRITQGQYTQERPSSFAKAGELEDVHDEFLRAARELRTKVVETIGRSDLLVCESGVVAEMVGVGLSKFPTAFHVDCKQDLREGALSVLVTGTDDTTKPSKQRSHMLPEWGLAWKDEPRTAQHGRH